MEIQHSFEEPVANVRPTEHVKAGGCASKLPPGFLHSVLARLPNDDDRNLLVGFDLRLLLSAAAHDADALLAEFQAAGVATARIGCVLPQGPSGAKMPLIELNDSRPSPGSIYLHLEAPAQVQV